MTAPAQVRQNFSDLLEELKHGALPDDSDLSIEPLEESLPHAFTVGYRNLLVAYQVMLDYPLVSIFQLMWVA